MISVGKVAPDFTLQDQNGDSVTLSEMLTKGPLIVYFYPADFTPGCTKEACSIRDMHSELLRSGLTILGVSPQSVDSHRRFADQHNLNFTLLADPDKQVVKAFDVDGPLGFGVRRASFLIGTDGVIADAILADLVIGRHEAFFRRAAKDAAQQA